MRISCFILTITLWMGAGCALAYEFPPRDLTVADVADDGDPYLVEESGTEIAEGDYLFQHARQAAGEAFFVYELPVDPDLPEMFITFLEHGECRVEADGVLLLNEGNAGPGKVTAREVRLHDPGLWADGRLRLTFSDSHPADDDGGAIEWIEAGRTSRFREKLTKVQLGTERILWNVGVWDGRPHEFQGTGRILDLRIQAGKTIPPAGSAGFPPLLREVDNEVAQASLPLHDTSSVVAQASLPVGVAKDEARHLRGNRRLWLRFAQEPVPGMRYWFILGYRGTGEIDIHADGRVEVVSQIEGLEALDFDITDYLPADPQVPLEVEVRGSGFIDFLALVEARPSGDRMAEERIGFGGPEWADAFGKVANNTLFWTLNSHYDHTGFLDASPVGGNWHQQYWPIDIAVALRELVGWGYLEQAERAARLCAEVKWQGHETNRSGSSDNTAGHLICMDMINIIERRGLEPEVVEALWPPVTDYLDMAAEQVDASEWNLIRGTNWENAGNRQNGGCLALSTNGGLYYAFLAAADFAERIGNMEQAEKYDRYADKVREAMMAHLRFEEPYEYGEDFTAPAGIWKYGINEDGSLFLNPLAGWSWFGFFGHAHYGLVDPDQQLRSIMRETEDFRHHVRVTPGGWNALGFNGGYEGELDWSLTTALSDKPGQLGTLVKMLVDEATDYREDVGADECELSRWAWGSPGGTEDTNLVGTAVFLGLARILAGVDDQLYADRPLEILPRLPWDWTEAYVNDWPVRYERPDGGVGQGELWFRYNRSADEARLRFAVEEAPGDVPVRVRLGPFPLEAQTADVQVNGISVSAPLSRTGDAKWVWVETDAAGEMEVTARVE